MYSAKRRSFAEGCLETCHRLKEMLINPRLTSLFQRDVKFLTNEIVKNHRGAHRKQRIQGDKPVLHFSRF